jgi:uncharacterized membrane protein
MSLDQSAFSLSTPNGYREHLFMPISGTIGLGLVGQCNHFLGRPPMKVQHRFLIIAAEIPVAIAVSLLVPQFIHAETPTSPVTPKTVAKPSPKPSPKAPEVSAGGTEPFWGVTIDTSGIVYSTPDSPKVRFPYVKPLQAEGRQTGSTMVYPLRKGNQQGTIVLQKVQSGFCNDGMSDYQYPYSATLILNNRVFSGCASTPTLPRKMG